MDYNNYKLGPVLDEDEIVELNPLDRVCIRFYNESDGYSYDVIGMLGDLTVAPIWDVGDDDFVTTLHVVELA